MLFKREERRSWRLGEYQKQREMKINVKSLERRLGRHEWKKDRNCQLSWRQGRRLVGEENSEGKEYGKLTIMTKILVWKNGPL